MQFLTDETHVKMKKFINKSVFCFLFFCWHEYMQKTAKLNEICNEMYRYSMLFLYSQQLK